MKTKFILFISLILSCRMMGASYGFENGVSPAVLADAASGTLTTTSAPCKEGTKSLKWEWTAPSILKIDAAVTNGNYRDGVIFWVYNETPKTTPLRCEYRSTNGSVQYYFDYNLNFTGWRICRIGTKYMKGGKTIRNNLRLHLVSPANIQAGTLYIDRLSFVSDVSYQNAPDAQMPDNNEAAYINHWNSLWKWENHTYDIPLRAPLTAAQKASLDKVMEGIKKQLPKSAQASKISAAKTQFANAGIRREGNFIIGSPLVVDDDAAAGDIKFAAMGTILYGLAQDAYFNQSEESRNKFLLAWDFTRDQGFDLGSSMGSNHHYGYQVREIFLAMFLMRDVLKTEGKLDEAAAALGYWSGLPESRTAYDNTRDGVVDSWNTLLLARMISAGMIDDECRRYQAVESLVRWVDGSLLPAPGNIGGIKPDGCIFHHGGHYPAYAIGGLAGLGKFFDCINESDFEVSAESRLHLAESLFAMSRYTNFKDWSSGISGRHPLSGSMSTDVVNTFGYLALSGGIYNPSETIDTRLAAEYMRLETSAAAMKLLFSQAGIAPAQTPSGFYVFNHACLGVHRHESSMVSIKGYNSDVWGSEIYTKDNRYGRYQSYGAVEIFNGGTTVTRSGSRFTEDGWDWNRIPGTTTLHLPLDRLESPQAATLMARSAEDFAGASSLEGRYGIFAMKLKEQNDINNNNYTPGFTARKSVFAFGRRLVCLGSNISNSNANFETETTLFQNTIRNISSEKIDIDGTMTTAYTANKHLNTAAPIIAGDLAGNYYRLAPNTDLYIKGGRQQSKNNKTKAQTEGRFAAGWINHGTSPNDASYEYMIMLKPSAAEVSEWKAAPQYEVIQCDENAHIVKDNISGTTGYACFNQTVPKLGNLLLCDEETLVMLREENNTLTISVCSPSINLPEKVKNSETTVRPGTPATKQLTLKGSWAIEHADSRVNLRHEAGSTIIEAACLLGAPVEFILNKAPSSTPEAACRPVEIHQHHDQIIVNGLSSGISIYSIDGRLLYAEKNISRQRIIPLKRFQAYLVVAEIPQDKNFHQIIVM